MHEPALKFFNSSQVNDFLNQNEQQQQQPIKDTELWQKHSRNPNSPPQSLKKLKSPRSRPCEILDHIAALAYKHAKDTFTLPGIGKLVLKNRAARMGRNPKTGETIQIKAKRVVKFRVAKAAKDAILGGK